ncbi:hypothetical protein DMH02_014020 [Streptomyces sp. WAC 00631]|uniref:hypothetical protein n=1 Tax=unclassified Streptomyces TaxID=2593676 RepID=UPI000F7B25CA|nr:MULTISPECIES: hypothetical protein [unclassified Streptomyces]MCC5034311.1 hypothetical protein [Streptomyces sp. WAC 00631]MCC9742311.1 hypothetical protein [Streptomyces sp. MNU89]
MTVPDGAERGRTQVLFAAAGAARAVFAGIRRRPPGGAALWERRNHAGRPVDLYAGPAVVLGTALAAATVPGLPARVRGAAALAVLAAGACGAYDDLVGRNDARRGFRAHLTALRHGEITSGGIKLLGIGAAGLAAGALVRRRPLDALPAGLVVAGAAHLVNLLDVRPGRAAKAVLAMGAPLLLRGGAAGLLCAAPMGAAAALLADDLDERTMLGDTGAHALGAGLGVAVAAGSDRAGLLLSAAVLLAAAVAGERIGDGPAWLDRPVLRVWDALGRRPDPVSVFSRGATPVRVTGGRRG